jgi:hypothetical protein
VQPLLKALGEGWHCGAHELFWSPMMAWLISTHSSQNGAVSESEQLRCGLLMAQVCRRLHPPETAAIGG